MKQQNAIPHLLCKKLVFSSILHAVSDTYDEGKLKVLKAERTMTASTDEEGQGNRVHAKSNECLEDVPEFPTVSGKYPCCVLPLKVLTTRSVVAEPTPIVSMTTSLRTLRSISLVFAPISRAAPPP